MFDNIRRCVSCGELRDSNHKCSKRHEAAKKSAQTNALNNITEHDKRYYGSRLQEAQDLMNWNYR